MDRIDGYVDASTLTPMVTLKLLSDYGEEFDVSSMVDTGYNGDMILPEGMINKMKLEYSGTSWGELADGAVSEMKIFKGRLRWFDTEKEILVGATRSDIALMGTLLLADCELNVNFKDSSVMIQRVE